MKSQPNLPTAEEYKSKLLAVFSEFEGKTFEREELIRLIMLAIFCKQHIFLFGKPGVGKTYIARLASNVFGEGHYWEILMAHDTTTEQLMGSLKKDENGQVYRDLSDSMLDKPFPFLDEMFKGSNKVLNALLGPMLDRKYVEGRMTIDVPLVTLFGASNEFPEGEDIKPFEDRLMFRYNVLRLEDWENKIKYNNGDFDQTPQFQNRFNIEDIDIIEKESAKIEFSRVMLENYIRLQEAILKDGILISDRKFGPSQAVKVFRTSAYLNGRKSVDFSDLMLLKHIAWHSLVDKKKLDEVLHDTMFGNPVGIEKAIGSVEDPYVRFVGVFKSEFIQIINLEKEYVGAAAPEEFFHDRRRIEKSKGTLEKIRSEARKISETRANAFLILGQCEQNIFLYDTKQTAYNESMQERIDTLLLNIESDVSLINGWLDNNTSFFVYNNARLGRSAG